MASTRDDQHRERAGAAGEPAAPRVIRLPSPRRLLRPGPTLVLLALLLGTASAPQGPGRGPAGGPDRRPVGEASVTTPGASRWYEEVVRRDPAGSAATGTAAVPAPAPVLLTVVPAALEGPASGAAVDVRSELWAAYRDAAAAVPASCRLDPRLLAAIGQVESGSLAGRGLDARHRAVPPVLGPVLDGAGFARIPDTDGGRLDGDPVWDRAVGPMQFIPSTWSRWGRDADGDGVADPQGVEDAALSAAGYLCAGGRDLAQPRDLRSAVLSYNHSDAYLATVLALVPRMAPGVTGPGLVTGPVTVAPAVWSAATVGPPATQPRPSASRAALPSTPTRTAGPTRTPAAGPTTTTARPTTASPTTAPTTSTTSTTGSTSAATSSTGTSSTSTTTASASPTSTASSTPSATPSPTTTPGGCASPSATPSGTGASATSTASTTADPDPASSASPSPTCTPSPTTTATPVPSTSSATAAEATLLGDAGAAG